MVTYDGLASDGTEVQTSIAPAMKIGAATAITAIIAFMGLSSCNAPRFAAYLWLFWKALPAAVNSPPPDGFL